MSSEVAIYEGMTPEQIMALLGQDSGSESLPQLKINSDFAVVEDGEEYNLEPGSFKLDVPNVGTIYSFKKKGIRFRPMLQGYQYVRFDPDAPNAKAPKGKGAYVDRSVIETSFRNTEFLSELGGKRCGKTKETEGLTPNQIAINNQTSCYRLVYGTVSFEGRTLKGDDFTVTDQPVVLKLRGTNFMPFGDEVEKALTKAKKLLPSVEVTITTTAKKNGATTYYLLGFSFDKTQNLPFDASVIELVTKFKDTIKGQNSRVIEKHKDSLKGVRTPQDVADEALAEAIDGDSVPMPDDELPF